MKVRLNAFLLLFTFFIFTHAFAEDGSHSRSSLQVSQSVVTLKSGGTATITVNNTSGSVSVQSGNSSVVNASYANRVLTLKGLKAGTAIVTVKDRYTSQTISVSVVALQVNPTTVSLKVGASATITASNAAGSVRVESGDKSVVTASYASGVVTLVGVKAGSTQVTVKDSQTTVIVPVTVTAATTSLNVFPTVVALNVSGTSVITVSNASGTVTASSSKANVATIGLINGVWTATGNAVGSATLTFQDNNSTVAVNVTVISGTSSSTNYTLLAWNDLGMHCMDGLDFSVFTILPPYNTLHAQLKDKAGKLITSGVTLTYEAIADSTGSINTVSSTKTNFWDEVGAMLGLPPGTPPKDTGLNLDGMLSGSPAPGNPTPSKVAAPLSYNAAYGWYEAEGIPITPFDDAGKKNFYPTVKVIAKDLAGTILASTTTVLPVSDEMTCKACHTTDSPSNAAKPLSGWVLNEPDPDKNWKKNVLKLHDEKKLSDDPNNKENKQLYLAGLTQKNYNLNGLLATAEAGKPVLCVACHASNAYFDKEAKQTVMKGVDKIRPFTQALHTKHATVINPATQKQLDDATDRTSCYLCHPGSETQCLRGAMSQAKDTAGNLLSCQNCHGNLSAVGSSARQGWYNEPTCESCHNSATTNKRATTGVDAKGISIVPADHTFASNANTPVAGLNLYRFSKGHGGLQCEACHGATHAEYPSTHKDDNTQSINVQGHAGPVAECTACHKTIPTTVDGGPHGMHTTGNTWVSAHEHANKNGTTTTPSCAYCHGTTSAGTPLSAIKADKTINAGEFGTKSWKAGYQVSCYSCHNGPNP